MPRPSAPRVTKAQRKADYLDGCEREARHTAVVTERAAWQAERMAWYAVCEDTDAETAAAWYEADQLLTAAQAESERLQP